MTKKIPESCRYDAVDYARHALGMRLDKWQREVLRSESNRIILNCCRQAGKSTVSAVMTAHHAVYNENALCIVISPTQRQSSELFRKVQVLIEASFPSWKPKEDSKTTLVLPNDSRIVSLPGKAETVRGFSDPALIVEDEASLVGDDVYKVLRPMLAVSHGKFVLMSTPNGKRGHFYDEYVKGEEPWHRVQITAYDCPRMTKEYIETERKALGEYFWKQELMCEFGDSHASVFRGEDIDRAFSNDVEPLKKEDKPDAFDAWLEDPWATA